MDSVLLITISAFILAVILIIITIVIIKNNQSKKYKKEILWNGDAKYWGRQSPILFPIVGRLK